MELIIGTNTLALELLADFNPAQIDCIIARYQKALKSILNQPNQS